MFSQLNLLIRLVKTLGLSSGVTFFFKEKSKKDKIIIDIPSAKYPINLRSNTSDKDVFFQVFINREFDIDLGFEPKTIIDGGANIGLASVYFKNKFPSSLIVAVEPDSDNVNVLEENVRQYPNVYIKKAGLWPRKAHLNISDKYNMGKWAMVTEEFSNQAQNDSTNTVDTITLDDIIVEFKLDCIDLLKLDIESAEKFLFSENYMSWLPKTKAIIIELHDWMSDGCSKPFFTAINNGFQNYSLKISGENIVIINKDLL